MEVKLGELLIEEKLINQAQLEEALQAQVIFGGKLGTVLVEMGLINEDKLVDLLAHLVKIPCAKPEELQNIPEQVIQTIDAELAEKYKIVPLAVNGKKLTLAMANPEDLTEIDEISFLTGYIIQPVLALEVRLLLALEKYYSVKRTVRYIAPPQNVREELSKPPVVSHITEDSSAPAGGKPLRGPITEVSYTHKQPPKLRTFAGHQSLNQSRALDKEDFIEELVDEDISFEKTVQALVKAKDRNDVADALITYLGAHYARAALFMVIANQVTGWCSIKDSQAIPGFDDFQLALSDPSVLKTAVESKSYFLGPIPSQGVNPILTEALGSPTPTTAILLPMMIRGRIVGLIYVDDATVNLSEAVADIQKVVGRAIMAFEILILKNKILRS